MYTRDNNEQVTATTQTGVSEGNQSYSYASLNQLASANSASYAYDAADNVTQLPRPPVSAAMRPGS